MDSLKSQVKLLIERSENFRDQLNRFVSHLESEQRGMGNISKRVDDAHHIIKLMDDIIKKHERLLLNDGKGIAFRIDRLEQSINSNKQSVSTWISILSLLTSIGALVLMYLK